MRCDADVARRDDEPKALKFIKDIFDAKKVVAAVFVGCFQSKFGRDLGSLISREGWSVAEEGMRAFLEKEALDEHPEGNHCKIRSSKYLNNLIEQDHRSVKLRLGPMLGLKHFRQAATTIAGIELMHRIRKGQFKLGRLGTKGNTAPKIWNAVLAASSNATSRRLLGSTSKRLHHNLRG